MGGWLPQADPRAPPTSAGSHNIHVSARQCVASGSVNDQCERRGATFSSPPWSSASAILAHR
eukprot:734612-Rhodomonas_salina.1